jgi:hypothetical protein
MNPLAVDFEKLRLADVQNNGESWSQFDPHTRILSLPAGAGGLFEVAYKMDGLPDFMQETATKYPVDDLLVHPNPFNEQLTFSFTLNQPQRLTVKIYNPLGQLIDEIHSGSLVAGKHQLLWKKNIPEKGLYFYTLEADGMLLSGKVIAQ